MKSCARCGASKPRDDFPLDRSRVDGRFPYCKACHAELQRITRSSWDDLRVDQHRATGRRKYRRWRMSDAMSSEIIKAEAQLRRYGLTPADYLRLLEAQGGTCAFARCPRRPGDERHGRLHVDHCHVTGVVRGLLCFHHNAMLGHAADDPVSLVDGASYLAAPPAMEVFAVPRRPIGRRLPRSEVRSHVSASRPAVTDEIATLIERRLDLLRRAPTLF